MGYLTSEIARYVVQFADKELNSPIRNSALQNILTNIQIKFIKEIGYPAFKDAEFELWTYSLADPLTYYIFTSCLGKPLKCDNRFFTSAGIGEVHWQSHSHKQWVDEIVKDAVRNGFLASDRDFFLKMSVKYKTYDKIPLEEFKNYAECLKSQEQ